MKIENNGAVPISPKRTENSQAVSKKNGNTAPVTGNRPAIAGKDHVEVTESARTLAKARAALDNVQDVENDRVEMLKQQVASGNYTVPVEALAKKMMAATNLWDSGGEK